MCCLGTISIDTGERIHSKRTPEISKGTLENGESYPEEGAGSAPEEDVKRTPNLAILELETSEIAE